MSFQPPAAVSFPVRPGRVGSAVPTVIPSNCPPQHVNSGCLLCLDGITPLIGLTQDNSSHRNDVFQKLCDVFKVNLTPFSWNFVEEPFPFCSKCATSVFSLYELYEKVRKIEESINQTISFIKSTIKGSETNKTCMPTDVRSVIFRGQMLKDLENWTPNVLSPEVIQPIVETKPSIQPSKPKARAGSTLGLVYKPLNGADTADPRSKTCVRPPRETIRPQPLSKISTSAPTLVAVASLEENSTVTESAGGQRETQPLSRLVAESMNVMEGSTHLEAEVEFRQLLGVVEVYPNTSVNSPTKFVRNEGTNEITYVAANETIITQDATKKQRKTEGNIRIEVAPTNQIDLENDFETYNDDSYGDLHDDDSRSSEDDDEEKKAVAVLEKEMYGGSDSDYVPKRNSPKKRKRSHGAMVIKKENVAVQLVEGDNSESVDSESSKLVRKKNRKGKTVEGGQAKRPRSEPRKYVSLIQTDSRGRMFYEGIQIKTCASKPNGVRCGECGKECSTHTIAAGNKKTLIKHIRAHHLDEWYDGDQLVRRTRAPPVSYVSMLETNDDGRVFFKGHEIVGAAGNIGFSCGTCGKAYTGKSAACENRVLVMHHIQGEHLGVKFSCDQCDASYKSKGSLYDHKLKKHTMGEMECDICGRKLFRKYMDYHRFTHMNEEEKTAAIAAGTAPAKVLQRVVPYICNICGMILKGTEGLRRHEKTHMNDTAQCNLCDKQIRVGSMHNHIRHVHQKNGPRRGKKCPHCGIVTRDMKRHLISHMPKFDRPFECSICGQRHATEKSNRLHEESKHKEGATRFKENYILSCDLCTKKFLSKKSRRDHLLRVHRREYTASKHHLSSPQKKEVEYDTNDSLEVANVDYTKMGRHLDMDVSEGAKADTEMTEEGEMSFLTVKITESSDGYECGLCGAKVRRKMHDDTGLIKLHIRAHHLGEFQCDECGKFWDKLSKLTKHKKAVHSAAPCPVCQRPSGSKNLQHHLWTHKSQEEKQSLIDAGDFYKIPVPIRKALGIPGLKFDVDCEVCGMTLPNKLQLEIHQKSEHSETRKSLLRRRFEVDCELCGNNFPNQRLLEAHQRSEHPETRKIWNMKKRGAKNQSKCRVSARNVKTEDEFDDIEDDEYSSLSETDESEISDSSEIDEMESSDKKIKLKSQSVKPIRPTATRSSSSKLIRQAPTNTRTNSTNTDKKPHILISRLPGEVLNAKKFKVESDGILKCIYSDGEVKEVSTVFEDPVDQQHFEIHMSSSEEENYSSGDEEDFALIPGVASDCD